MNAPMWVHWLGDGYCDVIDELAHGRLSFDDHYSTDLPDAVTCVLDTTTHSFCTSARCLECSMNTARENEVLSVVSPTRFVSKPAWVSEEVMVALNIMHEHCGNQYRQ